MTESLIAKLGGLVELSCNDAASLQQLIGKGLSLKRGECPLSPSDHQHWAMIMLNGWAARYREHGGSKRIVTELVLPGEFLAPMSFIEKSTSTVMLSSGEVMLIPAASFAKLKDNDRLRKALDHMAAIREAILGAWLVRVASQKAQQRLAHLLCELGCRMNSAHLMRRQSFELPLTQADLASALALSSVHVNVAMQHLRREGIIELEAKRLTILDCDRLRMIGEFSNQYLGVGGANSSESAPSGFPAPSAQPVGRTGTRPMRPGPTLDRLPTGAGSTGIAQRK